ncbi:MAG: helix-turn-helix transcriptional regulator [Proteobacteria bacterium]|nr:helix-turn-helix transcriptional regulator [Pseudomonadota bacterium]
MSGTSDRPTPEPSLGDYLSKLRGAAGMTLREVEEATRRDVSNAYLSQLENGKINRPSPNILHALARVYGVNYEDLMERAGYLVAEPNRTSEKRHGRVATFAIDDITTAEENQILEYVAFLKSQRKRK